jgi:hypothetical protein
MNGDLQFDRRFNGPQEPVAEKSLPPDKVKHRQPPR